MSRHNRERRANKLDRLIKEQITRAEAEGRLLPGTVHLIDVRHDSRCALLAGRGRCDCSPQVCPLARVPAPEEN